MDLGKDGVKLTKADETKFLKVKQAFHFPVGIGSDEVQAIIQTIQGNAELRPYLQAYGLAYLRLGVQLNLNDPQHQHFLGIALQAKTNPDGLRNLNRQAARDLLEMEHMAGLQKNQYLDDIGLHYGAIGKAGSWLGVGSMLARGLHPAVAAGIWGLGLYFGNRAEEISNIPRYAGHDPASFARFHEDIFTREFVGSLRDSDYIRVTSDGLLHVFSRALDNEGIAHDRQAQYLSAFQQELQDQIQNIHVDVRNLTEEQRRMREMARQFIAGNKMIQHSLRDLRNFSERFKRELNEIRAMQREQKLQAEARLREENFQKQIQNAKLAFGFVSALGQVTGNRDLQRAAVIANSAVDIYAGFSALSIALATGGPLTAIAGPLGMIGTAAIQIFSAFRKQKPAEDRAAKAIMNQIQILSDYMQSMRAEMREYFRLVLEGEQMLYEAVMNGFQHLDQLLRSEIRDFKVPVLDSLRGIEANLDRLRHLINKGSQALLIKDLEDTIRKMEAYRDELAPITSEAITTMNIQMLNWITPGRKKPPTSASEFFTGEIWLEGLERGDPAEWTNQVFGDRPTPDSLWNLLGYLIRYPARLHVEWKVPAEKKLDANLICNPTIWLNGVDEYLPFKEQFRALIPDPKNLIFQRLKMVGGNLLTLVEAIQQTPELYQALFRQCESSIDRIQRNMAQVFSQKNRELQRKITGTADGKEVDAVSNLDQALTLVANKTPTTEIVGAGFDCMTYLQGIGRAGAVSPIKPQKLGMDDLRPEDHLRFSHFVLLEKCDLGKFEMKHHINFISPAAPNVADLKLQVNFQYSAGEAKEAKTFPLFEITYQVPNQYNIFNKAFNQTWDGETTNEYMGYYGGWAWGGKVPSALALSDNYWARKKLQAVSFAPNIDALDAEVKAKLNAHLLTHRITALAGEPFKTNIQTELKILSGNIKLLLAYAELAGFQMAEQLALKNWGTQLLADISAFCDNPATPLAAFMEGLRGALGNVTRMIQEKLAPQPRPMEAKAEAKADAKLPDAAPQAYRFDSPLSAKISDVLFKIAEYETKEAQQRFEKEQKRPMPEAKRGAASPPADPKKGAAAGHHQQEDMEDLLWGDYVIDIEKEGRGDHKRRGQKAPPGPLGGAQAYGSGQNLYSFMAASRPGAEAKAAAKAEAKTETSPEEQPGAQHAASAADRPAPATDPKPFS